MQLYLSIPVFVCLVVSIYSQPAPDEGLIGFTDKVRVVKRSPGSNALVIIGKAAEDFLLKGTYYKQIDSSGYKLFEKQGQFSDALRDFNTVRPKNAQIRNQSTHSHIFRKQVKVGDRKIQLRHNYNDVGTRGLPQILISNPVPGELPYKIVYTKNKR